jgi:competence protein ComEC
MATVIRSFDVGRVYMPDVPSDLQPSTVCYTKMTEAIEKKSIPTSLVYSGDKIDTSTEADVSILGPVKGEAFDSLNDYSIVMKIKYGKRTFLFMGDSENTANSTLMDTDEDFSADVIKVGHHGSADATNYKLLSKVIPQYAVLSLGKDNDYGYPHDEVIKLLSDFECTVYRTDKDETVLFECNGDDISVKTGLRSIVPAQ